MSQFDANMHESRLAAKKRVTTGDAKEQFTGKEEELARLCIDEIQRRRWYFTRNIPGRYSTSTPGTVDLIIAASNGVTYWVELKKKSNKLSEAQNITRHVLLALNHRWACVYNFEQFVDFIS